MNTFEPQKLDNEIIKELLKNSLNIINYGKFNFIPLIIFLDILTGTLLSSYHYTPLYNILINLFAGPLILVYFVLHIEVIRQIKDHEYFSVNNILFKSLLILKNNFFYIKKYMLYYYLFSTIIVILSLPLIYYNSSSPLTDNHFYNYISKICIGTNMFFFFCFIFESKSRSHSILFTGLNIIYNDCNEAQANMMVEKSSRINEKKLSLIKICVCIITIIICLKFYILFPFFAVLCIAFQFCIWDYIFNNKKGLEEKIEQVSLIDINNKGVI